MSRQRLLLFALGCLVLSGASGFFALPSRKRTEPRLLPSPAIHSFGSTGQGQSLTIDVELTNEFPLPVQIIDVSRGCSCSSVKLKTNELASGETTVLSIDWNTGSQRGPIEEQIGLIYRVKDGRMGTEAIKLVATVEPDFDFEPKELTFERGNTQTQTIRFSPKKMADLKLKNSHCNQNGLTATLNSSLTEVSVSYVSEKLKLEGPGAYVTIETNSLHEQYVKIPVRFKGIATAELLQKRMPALP